MATNSTSNSLVFSHDMVSTVSSANSTAVILQLSASDILPQDFNLSLKIIFIVLYTAIILSAILGNTALVFVVVTTPSMRNVTNMFLVSLALSDILIAVWNMPFQLSFYIHNEWLLGNFMCKFTGYIQGVNVVSSTFALTGIAIERYYAICHPIKARKQRTIKKTLTMLGVVWLLSFGLLVPQIFIQKLQPMIKIDLSEYPGFSISFVCVEVFDEQYTMMVYTFFFYIALYLLPLTIMLVTYGKITHRLWIRQPIGDVLSNPQNHLRHIRQNRKVVKTLITVVLLFAICWFPFFTAQIYTIFNQVTYNSRILTAVFQLIGYMNSCLNPILYAFMNDTFRRQLCISLFSRCKRKKRDNANVSITTETGV